MAYGKKDKQVPLTPAQKKTERIMIKGSEPIKDKKAAAAKKLSGKGI